ncbi:preprotein translocase subunit SecY [Pseudonocardia eucalypti]|uniref:Protein translocase subunit SecY n=1 Tax=Pseudonocardia eucalypti TaxID=648755 RepID=A0ABP9QL97_9PSEU
MLRVLRTIFTQPELRKRILFTLALVAAARLGSAIPLPGVSFPNVQQCLLETANGGGAYAMFNLFSGGALLQLSVFALGVTPYITASIVVHTLGTAVPRFEQLRQEGPNGQAKLNQYSRYLTVAIAVPQATAVVALAASGRLFGGCRLPVIPAPSTLTVAIMVLVMVTGGALLMWLGELITERGIGRGMSVLLFTSIAHRIPVEAKALLDTSGVVTFVNLCVFGLLVVVGVVFIEQAQRRIPVRYAKAVIDPRVYRLASSYLPLKVNQAGVLPVIFASSVLFLPDLASRALGNAGGSFLQGPLANPSSAIHIAAYAALVVFFCYFHARTGFNPAARAREIGRRGGFVPGVRPGPATAGYLRFVLGRLTAAGAVYLAALAVLPSIVLGAAGSAQNQNLPLGGTSALIMVGVALDTAKQVETHLVQDRYQGFLR